MLASYAYSCNLFKFAGNHFLLFLFSDHYLLFVFRKGSNVLELLGKVAAYALDITGFFYCQITPALKIEDGPKSPEQL